MLAYELECKSQFCIDSSFHLYDMIKLCMNKWNSSVVVIGSTSPWRSSDFDDFNSLVDAGKFNVTSWISQIFEPMGPGWGDNILWLC